MQEFKQITLNNNIPTITVQDFNQITLNNNIPTTTVQEFNQITLNNKTVQDFNQFQYTTLHYMIKNCPSLVNDFRLQTLYK